METNPPEKLYYSALRFKGVQEFEGFETEADWTLRLLSTVNVFVGANNSGKSRFLRALFVSKNYGYKTSLFVGDELRNYLKANQPGGPRLTS